jgi:hypothetical protein
MRLLKWYPPISELFGVHDHNAYIEHSIDNNELVLYCKSPESSWNNLAATWHPVSHVFKPIPIQIEDPKILYWELTVEIEQKGKGNAMGLMITNANLSSHMPGWERGTYAMHSDDGHAYYNNDSTIFNCKSFAYGPAYQTPGVVIGCGYNFITSQIFFTHNGLLIGPAFVIPSLLKVGEICPCIGMMTPNSIYRVNVGQKPFMFNIDAYICGENIETFNLTFDESEAGVNHYRVSRKDTIEKMQTGGPNFLQVFTPSGPTQLINTDDNSDSDEISDHENTEDSS